jgi:hypothetical protein
VTNFEERLLVELRSRVEGADSSAERGRRRPLWRRPRLAVAGGLAVAAVAAATVGVVFLSTGTQAAYAVTKNADGTVTVEIDSLTDAAGLQANLQAAGVNAVVEYLPTGKMCREPWFTPAGPASAGGQTSSVGKNSDGSFSFTISNDIPAGDTLVISTQSGGGFQALGMAIAQGTVPPCQVVDAPAGSGPLGGPPVSG